MLLQCTYILYMGNNCLKPTDYCSLYNPKPYYLQECPYKLAILKTSLQIKKFPTEEKNQMPFL